MAEASARRGHGQQHDGKAPPSTPLCLCACVPVCLCASWQRGARGGRAGATVVRRWQRAPSVPAAARAASAAALRRRRAPGRSTGQALTRWCSKQPSSVQANKTNFSRNNIVLLDNDGTGVLVDEYASDPRCADAPLRCVPPPPPPPAPALALPLATVANSATTLTATSSPARLPTPRPSRKASPPVQCARRWLMRGGVQCSPCLSLSLALRHFRAPANATNSLASWTRKAATSTAKHWPPRPMGCAGTRVLSKARPPCSTATARTTTSSSTPSATPTLGSAGPATCREPPRQLHAPACAGGRPLPRAGALALAATAANRSVAHHTTPRVRAGCRTARPVQTSRRNHVHR